MEIPPRARRRAILPTTVTLLIGNTSACAEKRRDHVEKNDLPRKYLRVRGEESMFAVVWVIPLEIPPRARRRGEAESYHGELVGNTSACAEKS